MSRIKRFIMEVHRRSLWQVLGVYLVGAWVVYEVVLALVEGLGLPSWVAPAAVVLLLIELPVVLATAVVHEGPPQLGGRKAPSIEGLETTAAVGPVEREAVDESRPDTGTGIAGAEDAGAGAFDDSAAYDASREKHPAARHLTWRRATVGGVLAFAFLGVGATGFMGMRALGIGPAGTLIAKGVLEDRARLLVADFDSPPADSLTAAALSDALRIDLSQSPALRVVDPEELQLTIALMELPPGTALNGQVARDVAVREGIPVILVGDLSPVGSAYQLKARLLDPDTGTVFLRLREEAPGEDALLEAVDRLAGRLRERVGESLRTVQNREPLGYQTTASVEALKLYARAQRAAVMESDNRKAADLLEEALALDSTFAGAWRKLGVVLGNMGTDRARRMEALTRAFELSDRLPDWEGLSATGSYYYRANIDYQKAIETYERAVERYPESWGFWNNLAVAYGSIGDFENAAANQLRAAEVRPTRLATTNLISDATAAGDLSAARRGLALLEEHSPEWHGNLGYAGYVAYAAGDIGEARRLLTEGETEAPNESARGTFMKDLGRLDAREGRLQDAERLYGEAIELAARAGRPGTARARHRYLAWLDAFVRRVARQCCPPGA